MTKIKLVLLVVFALLSIANYSQTIQGIVLDQKTNNPIESAAVYFDGTSIGTSTNIDGEFQIPKVEGVTSPMIISFLGYQKTIISNYEIGKFYKILLTEDLNTLDEVVITTDDGLPKEIKLQHFRREFLGNSENGKSCTILNESDLILRFNGKTKKLTVSSKKPVQIQNDNLRYLVAFDIQDFEIEYKYVDVLQKHFGIKSVIFTGTSFYTDLDSVNTRRTIKKRDNTYEGSVLHFMRALSKKQLIENEYRIFDGSFVVPPYKLISVTPVVGSQNVEVVIAKKINILYDKKLQSAIHMNADSFIIDEFGNYAPIQVVLFGGDMGDQRIGDSLPFDYQLIERE